MIDLKLSLNSEGMYDLSITNGRLDTINSFDTSLIMSFYGEARAAESEIPVVQRQGGWWGNLFNATLDYEYGSKLWLLYQARANNNTLNAGIAYLTDAFQWYVDDNYARQVNVTGTRRGNQIRFFIEMITPNNDIINFAADLWQETGKTP
jgi:phage gp46-like protein